MQVSNLTVRHFRKFKQLNLNFCPGINIIVGTNGAGKSSVLDAISYALSHLAAKLKRRAGSGKSIADSDITIGKNTASIETTFADPESGLPVFTQTLTATRIGRFKNKENSFKEVINWATTYQEKRSAEKAVSYPLLVHYKVNRAILDIPQRQAKLKNLEEPLSGYDAAFDGGGNFRSFFAWFREMEDWEKERRDETGDQAYKLPELQAVRQALSIVLPEFTDIRIRRKHQAMVATKNGVEISIAHLSDGEKCYLALVGDIACRLARLNALKQKSATDILQSAGIVLIDELDLHLHPKWQREAIRRLPQIFPRIQFIITTHSLMILRELSIMQCRSELQLPVKFFSLTEKIGAEACIEEATELNKLHTLTASDLQLEQDSQLLSCYGYEL